MSYIGKKPVDFNDVTEAQTFSVTGDLTVDTDTLYVDSTNNRVGVGIASPSHLLDVQRATNGTQARFIVNDGSINPRLMIYGSASGSHIQHTSSSGSKSLIFEIDGSEGSGTEAARIDGTRTLGVGTTNLLDASGYVSANGAVYGKGFATANGRNDNAGFLTGLGITNGNNGSTNNGVVTGRLVAYIGGRTVTSDSNADGDSGASLEFFTKGENAVLSKKMSILSNGHVLINRDGEIGTTFLNIGGVSSSVNGIGVQNGTDSSLVFSFFIRNASATTIGSISNNGSTTSFNTSSDYRLKENVTDITDGITRLKLLNPSRFNFIADADRTVDGFLAHEVSNIVPEAITGEKDAVDEEGNPEYQGIDQSKLVPLLTAALQEAVAKIETLETQRADLEARLTTLENA